MAFDDKTRRRLFKTVTACRNLLTEDFDAQLRGRFGIYADEGRVLEVDRLPGLDDAGREVAGLLRERIDHLAAGKGAQALGEAVHRLRREQAFTVLNRFAAVRMAEERDLISQSVGDGFQSRGFRIFEQVAGGTALGELYDRYRVYLDCLFDELSLDLGVLFDRSDAMGLLFPGEQALRALFDELNHPDIAPLWAEDETIGWIYQYYNDPEERKKMRKESTAPRNSRELAVRNQFFTPRYVVELLTDNTLGRIWYEMTKGNTRLKEQCRYLVHRPLEFFLPAPEQGNFPGDWSGVEQMREFWRTGDFTKLPENPHTGVAIEWMIAIAGDMGFEHLLPMFNTDHQSVMDEILIPAENGDRDRLAAVHPLLLMHCLWRIGVSVARGGGYGEGDRPIRDDAFGGACHIWEALYCRLTHRNDEASQEELLLVPVFVPHRPIKDPREIRLLDPACGSMHFGLYAFDLFETIYEEAWDLADTHADLRSLTSVFSSKEEFLREVPRLIIEHNIHGIDIDPRAVQIAGLSLWLRAQKAWKDMEVRAVDRPQVRRSNIVCAEPMPGSPERLEEFVATLDPPLLGELVKTVFDKMQLVGEAGSLLKIEEDIRTAIDTARKEWLKQQDDLLARKDGGQEEFFDTAEQKVIDALRAYAEQADADSYQRRLFADDAARGFAFIDLCRQSYEVALMNPPFGDASLPSKPYIEETYGDTKGDVYKAFVECFHARLIPAGYLGIISSRTGFFLGQSEDWRTRVVLRLFRPVVLADLGGGVLDAMVEVAAYVLRSLSASEARDLTHSIVPVLRKVVRDSRDRFSLPKWQASRGGLKRHQALAELEHLDAHGFVQRSSGNIVRYTPLWHSVNKVTVPPEPAYPPLVCVKALGEEDKQCVLAEAILHRSDSRKFVSDPKSFRAIPTSPFAYWATPAIRNIFQTLPTIEGEGREIRVGGQTGDDFRYLRLFWEIEGCGKPSNWTPFQKGGRYSSFYSDASLVVDWDNSRKTFRGFAGRIGRANQHPSSFEYYFRPGLTWPIKNRFSFKPWPMPAGCVFAHVGAAAFFDSDVEAFWAIMSSSVFTQLIQMTAGWNFEVGVIQQTPIPPIDREASLALGSLAQRAWALKRGNDSGNAVSHAFELPALLAVPGSTLSERATAWATRVRTSEETVTAIQAEIDDLAFRLYDLNAADRAALTSTLATDATTEAEAQASDDDDEATADSDAPELAADLLAHALGTTFGRWDIRYATGERRPPELPDPFAPLPVLRLNLADLQTLSAPTAEGAEADAGSADLESRLRRQFAFLPDPITVKVEGNEVVVEFPAETPGSRAEAARLAEKAGKRASEGNYGKAIDIYQRVLELQPSLHRARRDLAMIYAETGDVDNATNHLIEVLRLDPSDSWNWVVLGNLYASGKGDPATAETFIRKALELTPGDPWALNSLATFTQKAGRSAEALELFDQAIAANPDLPNPYLGKALVLDSIQQPDLAEKTLDGLFAMGRIQDARSHEVYENARNLYVRVQSRLAERQQSEAFKCVQNEKAELVALSGYPVEMTEGDLTGTVGAMIQIA